MKQKYRIIATRSDGTKYEILGDITWQGVMGSYKLFEYVYNRRKIVLPADPFSVADGLFPLTEYDIDIVEIL
jgi:hypothetical protein